MTEAIVQQHVAPVPNLTGVTKPQGADLTPTQQKHLDEVLAHFSKEDYELPVKEGDKKLGEEEKYWLVGPQSVMRYPGGDDLMFW